MSDQSIHPAIKPGTDQVKFVLNGREVVGFKGETIITVAQREGVAVPHYCWHPALSVAGNCRLCLVEIHMPNPRDNNKPAPLPKPAIACQTTISPGMVVYTESALAEDCQRGMMEFLLANHPLDCPICDRGGECQLQRYSVEYGQGHARMVDKKRRFVKPQVDPLIDIERNRCIMCTRCVRFNDEIAGEHVMGVFDRGEGNYIGTFGAGPVSNILSGNVIDICPVGCLTNKSFRFRARPWELLQTQSTGIFDSSGVKVTYWTRNAKLYRTTPPSRKYHEGYTVNEDTEEFIDNVTRFGSDFPFHESRWDESRLRIGASLLPAAFTEAVRQAAVGLAKVKLNHGANSIATLIGPRATMEEGYLAAKFTRAVVGNDNIDWRMSFDSTEAADAATLAFSHADGDLEGGFDAIILVNGDYLHTTPTVAMRLKEYARINNKPVILIGHHHDRYFAPESSLRFHCAPGATANALLVLAEAVGGNVSSRKALAEIFNVDRERIEALLEVLKRTSKKALLVQSLEDLNGNHLAQEVPAAIGLKQTLGDAWKYLPVLKARNAFGLYAVGAQPGRLAADEAKLRQAWGLGGTTIPSFGGLAARDIVEAIESGRIKGLLALGADVLAAYPDQDRLLAALDKLEFFVVTDLFKSPITEKAHVFIAAASHLEKDGTLCDVEGNLARLSEVEGLTGGARPDWETLTGLANIMGGKGFDYETVADVFKEMITVLVPGYQGSFLGLELPGPRNDYSVADPGGARRRTPEYNPGDYRVDGGHFRWTGEKVTPIPTAVPEVPEVAEGQFLVTWGNHIQGDDYHLNRASIRNILQVPAYVELHVLDAMKLDVEDHDKAILRLGEASFEVDVRVCQGPKPGTLYLPTGLGGVRLAGQRKPLVASLELLEAEAPAAVKG